MIGIAIYRTSANALVQQARMLATRYFCRAQGQRPCQSSDGDGESPDAAKHMIPLRTMCHAVAAGDPGRQYRRADYRSHLYVTASLGGKPRRTPVACALRGTTECADR